MMMGLVCGRMFLDGGLGGVEFAMQKVIEESSNVSLWVEEKPSMLVVDGRINRAALNYNQLKTEQLRKLLRSQGYYGLANVAYTILEVDGQLTVVPKDRQDEFKVLVIDDGYIELDVLEGTVGKPKQWLEHEVKARGLRVQDVFYGI